MKKLMVILIGFLVAYLLAACSGSDNTPATMAAVAAATTPLAAVTLPTVPPTTPTVTASSVLEFPYGNADEAGEEQVPGRYKTPAWFSLPFTFETTQVFRGIGEQLPKGELFGIAQGRPNLPPRQLLFWAVDPSVSVETTISQLRATPNMEVGPNQPVNVADLSGTQFDVTTQQDVFIPALGDLVGHQGDDWQPNSSKIHLRFIVLAVAGRTLLIYIEAPRDEFQDFVTEADQVLGTVKFEVKDSAASLTTTPLAAATPPTVPPTTSTVTASSILEFPYGNADEAGEEQAPGRYKTPTWFSLPFTFETTQVFRGIGEPLGQGQLFGIAQGKRNLPPRQLLFWALTPDVSTEEAISQVRATPQLEFSPNQTVTVAGISGTQFDVTTQQKADFPTLGRLVGVEEAVWSTNSPQVHLRFIVFPIADRTLLIYIEAPKDEFQDFVTEVDQVLGTVKFDVEASSASSTP